MAHVSVDPLPSGEHVVSGDHFFTQSPSVGKADPAAARLADALVGVHLMNISAGADRPSRERFDGCDAKRPSIRIAWAVLTAVMRNDPFAATAGVVEATHGRLAMIT